MILFLFLNFSSDSLLYSKYVSGHYFLTDNKNFSVAEKNGYAFLVFTGYPHYLNSDIYYILRTPTTTFTDTPIKIFEDPPSTRPPYDGSPVLVIDSSYNFKLHIFWNSERNLGGYPFWWQTDIFYSYSSPPYIYFPGIENVSRDTNSFDLFPSATCDLDNRIYVVYWKIKQWEESIYLSERDNFGNWTNKKITEENEIAENPLIITLKNNDKVIFYYEAISKKILARKFKNNIFQGPFEVARGYDYSVNFTGIELYITYIRNDSLFLKITDYSFNTKNNLFLDEGEGFYLKNPTSIFFFDTLFIFYEKGNNINSDIYLIKYKNPLIEKKLFVTSLGKNEIPIPLITSENEFFVFFQSDRSKYTETLPYGLSHIYFKKKTFTYTSKKDKEKFLTFSLPTDKKEIEIYNISGRKIKGKFKDGIYLLKNKKGENFKCILF
ncbi:MAG: hypothetical protein ABIN17_07880 [candidate division WOR-3 bacterium]